MKRLLDGSGLDQLLSQPELLARAVGQARVEPDVLLGLGERPEGYPELELLKHQVGSLPTSKFCIRAEIKIIFLDGRGQ